jgi:hypothetical protein
VSGQLHASAALPSESPWYELDKRLGGPQNWSGQCMGEKNFTPSGTRPSTLVRPTVASRSTDCPISAHNFVGTKFNFVNI